MIWASVITMLNIQVGCPGDKHRTDGTRKVLGLARHVGRHSHCLVE